MIAAASVLSGCMFTQWTDRAFLGSPADPPAHEDAQWAGACILPLAIVGDIITFPGQVIAMWIGGDWDIYHLPPKRVPGEGYASLGAAGLAMTPAEPALVPLELSPEQRSALVARIDAGACRTGS